MNRKIICRILDKRALAMYIAVFLLLFAVSPGQKGVMHILGGFSPRKSGALNILGIMRWNLCVLPPIAVSILFMEVEMGRLRIYTMIRGKNVIQWFLARFTGIAAANLVYLFLFVGLTEVWAGSGDYKKDGFYLFLLLFFLHSFLMSVVCAAFCAHSKGVPVSVVFYLVVEGIMVVIGNIVPQTAFLLLPYWGMIRQVGDASGGGICYLFLIMGVSAGLIVGAALLMIKSLRK